MSESHHGEQPGHAMWQSAPSVHTYNPHTNTWGCVGEIPYEVRRSICMYSYKK